MAAQRPGRSGYARVSTQADSGDGGGESREQTRAERRQARDDSAEDISTKMHAAMWIVFAALTVYYTEIWDVCLSSPAVNRVWFNIGMLLFTASWTLILYMAVWVPRVMGNNLEPAVYSPRLVPATAVVSVLCGICLICGLWPVYGLFTPGIMFVLWLGALMTAHFMPSM